MATSGVFVLSLCCVYLSVDPVGGSSPSEQFSVSTEGNGTSNFKYSDAWGGYYKIHFEEETWERAQLTCESEGAVMATPYTLKATEALRAIMYDYHIECGIFIGVKGTASDYISLDGVYLCQIPHEWSGYKPEPSAENYLLMLSDGKITYESCSKKMPYVCYKKDQDCTNCGNICRSSDHAYKYDMRTGSCYKFHLNARTWETAVKTCENEGGHLAIINSELESEVLKAIYKSFPPELMTDKTHADAIHVGCHKFFGDWRTLDGKTFLASGWGYWEHKHKPTTTTIAYGRRKVVQAEEHPPGPGHYNGDQWVPDKPKHDHCCTMSHKGLLSALDCHQKCNYICEIEPAPLHVLCD